MNDELITIVKNENWRNMINWSWQ